MVFLTKHLDLMPGLFALNNRIIQDQKNTEFLKEENNCFKEYLLCPKNFKLLRNLFWKHSKFVFFYYYGRIFSLKYLFLFINLILSTNYFWDGVIRRVLIANFNIFSFHYRRTLYLNKLHFTLYFLIRNKIFLALYQTLDKYIKKIRIICYLLIINFCNIIKNHPDFRDIGEKVLFCCQKTFMVPTSHESFVVTHETLFFILEYVLNKNNSFMNILVMLIVCNIIICTKCIQMSLMLLLNNVMYECNVSYDYFSICCFFSLCSYTYSMGELSYGLYKLVLSFVNNLYKDQICPYICFIIKQEWVYS